MSLCPYQQKELEEQVAVLVMIDKNI